MTDLELAITRTQLANQRTYLAYMRTGFTVAAVAGTFKKWYLGLFGLLMVLVSTLQYYYVQVAIESGVDASFDFHYVPLAYSILSVLVLFLQFHKPT